MKVCIIGSSHIAPLKQAWDGGLATTHPSFEITFFGAIRDTLMHLKRRNGRLISQNAKLTESLLLTSGGIAEIDPFGFDTILVLGLCRNIPSLVANIDAGFSSAVIEQSVIDFWQNTNLVQFLKRLRGMRDQGRGMGQIFAGHSPMAAAPADNNLGTDRYFQIIELSNRLVFSTLGIDLLPQPRETIVNGNATDIRFAQGSRGLKYRRAEAIITHPGDEMLHMNQTYGDMCLEQFLRQAQLV